MARKKLTHEEFLDRFETAKLSYSKLENVEILGEYLNSYTYDECILECDATLPNKLIVY